MINDPRSTVDGEGATDAAVSVHARYLGQVRADLCHPMTSTSAGQMHQHVATDGGRQGDRGMQREGEVEKDRQRQRYRASRDRQTE